MLCLASGAVEGERARDYGEQQQRMGEGAHVGFPLSCMTVARASRCSASSQSASADGVRFVIWQHNRLFSLERKRDQWITPAGNREPRGSGPRSLWREGAKGSCKACLARRTEAVEDELR